MKNLKRTLSLALAMIMIVSTMMTSASAASASKIYNDFPITAENDKQKMTREQFCNLVVNTYQEGLLSRNKPLLTYMGDVDMPDFDEMDYTSRLAVSILYHLGILEGFPIKGVNYVLPDEYITRAEAVTILHRANLKFYFYGEVTSNPDHIYNDMKGHWAEKHAQYIYETRAMVGDEHNDFNPSDLLNIIQGISIIHNLFSVGTLTKSESINIICKTFPNDVTRNSGNGNNGDNIWDNGNNNSGNQTYPSKIILNSESFVELTVNGTAWVSAQAYPKNVQYATLTYASNNTSVCTVDSNGKITAKGTGDATIRISAQGGCSPVYVDVTVKNGNNSNGMQRYPSGINLYCASNISMTLNQSNYETVNAVAYPEGKVENDELTFRSSNTNVCTVDSFTGELYARGVGTATITVSAQGGCNPVTVTVTVTSGNSSNDGGNDNSGSNGGNNVPANVPVKYWSFVGNEMFNDLSDGNINVPVTSGNTTSVVLYVESSNRPSVEISGPVGDALFKGDGDSDYHESQQVTMVSCGADTWKIEMNFKSASQSNENGLSITQMTLTIPDNGGNITKNIYLNAFWM